MRILNTSMGGIGFNRYRNYDQNLKRLGQTKTAMSELRKVGDLNLNKQLKIEKKKMMTYSIKRFSKIHQRSFGMGDVVTGAATGVMHGVRDVAGTAVKTGGQLLDNPITKLGAGVAGIGAMGTGAKLGAAAGTAIGGPIGTVVGGALGALATPLVTAKAAGAAGQALKSAGEQIHT